MLSCCPQSRYNVSRQNPLLRLFWNVPNFIFFYTLKSCDWCAPSMLLSPPPKHFDLPVPFTCITFSTPQVLCWHLNSFSTGGSSLPLLMNSAAPGNRCTFCCIKWPAPSGLSYMDQPTSLTAGWGKAPHNSLTNAKGRKTKPKGKCIHEAMLSHISKGSTPSFVFFESKKHNLAYL